MEIKLDQILTISLRDYCESRCRKISDYAILGVHSFGTLSVYTVDADSPKHRLAREVPEGVEAVVGYNVQFMTQVEPSNKGPVIYEANGNALIPKAK